MHVRFASARPSTATAAALLTSGGTEAPDRLATLLSVPRALIDRAFLAARFEGEAGSIAELLAPQGDSVLRVLVVGTGKNGNVEDFEKAGAALVAKLLTSGESVLTVEFGATDSASAETAARLAFGAVLRSWRQDTYRTKLTAKTRPSLTDIILVDAPEGSEDAWQRLVPVAEGVAFTRELVTEPANILYPESFVERCRPLAELGVEIQVLDEAAMTAAGMGALLGVSQGSARPPRLLVLRWNGGPEGADPVALVGKGVTFDSGGISIKPAGGMEDMKWDMGGAAAVVGTMKALATRKAKANVIGVCGLVENMPSGTAQRPGDVVTTMSGQTVEVINTDAEGRLVLCDALTWLQRNYKVKTIIDLATLTGAIIISLGHEYAGMFANDDGLADQLLAAAKTSGDPLWRMPMGKAFDKMIDSPIADMKNVGGREGGSITAAQFIARFIDDGVRWAHLDIAGTVWTSKAGTLWDKGATGYGVRLLDRFVADNFEG